MDFVTTHVGADADGVACMVALQRLLGGLTLVLPGSMDPTARRVWRDHESLFPPLCSLRRFRQHAREGVLGTLHVVDSARPDRLGPLTEHLPGFRTVRAWDTHPPQEGDLPREDLAPAGACASVLVAHLLAEGCTPSPAEAGLFLVGIHSDTGHFTYPSTTPLDLEAAAQCRRWGAPEDWPRRYTPRGFTAHQLHLMEAMARRVQLEPHGDVQIALISVELDSYEPDLSVLLGQLREAEGWDAAFLVAAASGRLWSIGRSAGAVDVGRVMRDLGGGGHRDAASAVLSGVSLRDGQGLIRALVQEQLGARRTAGDLASRPLVTLDEGAPVRVAADVLHRHRINALPLVRGEGRGRRFTGQISRRDVDAALRHGMADRPARDFSVQAPAWVAPGASLIEARRVLLHSPGRIVMVGTPPGDAQGVLTRTLVLREVVEGQQPRGRAPQASVVRSMLERGLPDRFAQVEAIGQVAASLGMSLHLVGGSVRDLFIERESRDVDLVTEGDAIALARAVAERIGGRVHAHEAFATATWTPPGWERGVDIATARAEYYEAPAALPRVHHAELRRDLYRRDFSINAVAISVTPGELGLVRDPFSGLVDLRDGVLRVLHGLSFHDDPTRALRAARFAARFDFHLARDTEALLRAALRADVFEPLSPERLGHELELLLNERSVVQAFRLLRSWHLAPVIAPALAINRGLLAQLQAAIDARQRGLGADGQGPSQADLLWLVLAGALPVPVRAARARMVPGGGGRRQRWLRAPERVRRALRGLAAVKRHSTAAARLQDLDPVELLYACSLTRAPVSRDWLEWWRREGRHIRADIDGNVLIELGLPAGPQVGRGLQAALACARDGGDVQAQTRAALRAVASR